MNSIYCEEIIEKYDIYAAAAWVRGHSIRSGKPKLKEDFINRDIEELSIEEQCDIVKSGIDAKLKMYHFKKRTRELARVRRVMGFLRSLQFESMLDVGSGRGVFLIPFMKEFPWVTVSSLDILNKRVEFLNELSMGGFGQMHSENLNICDNPFPENSFDVVTMLEVLEHIPDVEKAIGAAVSMAKQYVVVTVPSKPDDNPEHIHFLTKEKLTTMFIKAGCTKLHFDGVEGHLVMIATINEKQVM